MNHYKKDKKTIETLKRFVSKKFIIVYSSYNVAVICIAQHELNNSSLSVETSQAYIKRALYKLSLKFATTRTS